MMSARNEDNSEVDEMFAEAEKKFNDMYGGRVPKIPRKKKDAAEIQDLLAEAESDKHQLNSLISTYKEELTSVRAELKRLRAQTSSGDQQTVSTSYAKELAAARAEIEQLRAQQQQDNGASTSNECERLRKENAELRHKLEAATAATESDTTRIVRYAPNNPADEALRKFEERTKAKANHSTDSADSGRASIETVEYKELKNQYDKLVKDSDRRSQLYKNIVRNLRLAVTSLTGFEFKIFDDHVEVAYKKSSQDVFKFCIDGEKVEVLDTSSVQRYKLQMDRYIGGLNSIPCFLASVVMASEGQSR